MASRGHIPVPPSLGEPKAKDGARAREERRGEERMEGKKQKSRCDAQHMGDDNSAQSVMMTAVRVGGSGEAVE